MNADRRQEGLILYHISVSGQNSKDEFWAIRLLVALKPVMMTKQIINLLWCRPLINISYLKSKIKSKPYRRTKFINVKDKFFGFFAIIVIR